MQQGAFPKEGAGRTDMKPLMIEQTGLEALELFRVRRILGAMESETTEESARRVMQQRASAREKCEYQS